MTPFEAELLRRSVSSTYGPTAALGNVGDYFFKKGGAGPLQKEFAKDTARLTKLIPGVSNKAAVKVGQFAGRAAPLLSAVGNVADVADLITSDDGLDNKLVDAAGMGIGGTLGFVFGGGPLGASIGASVGKTVTDGIQGMFFGGTEKEKKLAEALALLEGGRI